MGRLGSSHKKIDLMIVIQTVLAREVGNWDGVLPSAAGAWSSWIWKRHATPPPPSPSRLQIRPVPTP